ncbi:phage tail assembly chaperone G [Edwardsiella piscicida]|uniref:phage tail assembly chaperone G n=1 Tax=Edwardsiella piscicida TaxID=1263550 RepID=UPI00370D6012
MQQPAILAGFLLGAWMFLKKEKFTHCEHSVELRELSALQRIEYMEYAAANQINDDGEIEPMKYISALNRMDIKLNAMLVAMATVSPEKMEDPTEMQVLQHSIMRAWPSDALGKAGKLVMALSGMLPPEPAPGESPDGTPGEHDAGKF